jgi:tripartite-type tricarboxylate transporter receptor subunit TctC
MLAVAAAALAFMGQALGQEYPTKAVRIIVPLTPGSGADIAGRIIAARLSEHWKQPVLVENRPGAGGQIGTAAVVKADPDGHTLLVQSSSHSANSAIYKSLPYDPQKAKPGQLAFASAGVGTSTHLSAEYFVGLAGLKMTHVPYKGSAEAIQDVLAGRVAFYMAPVNVALGNVKEGKLAGLGLSQLARSELLPQVPTIAEQGYPTYEVTLWFGMWAPAATPPQVVQKLNATVNAIVLEPNVKEQFAKLGIQPAPMKADEFARFVRSEIDVYRKIVRAANIEPQ